MTDRPEPLTAWSPGGGDRSAAPADSPGARIEFCGEVYQLDPEGVFVVGREGDLVVDDNPFLHRRFLELRRADGLWWLANVGSQLSATVADVGGLSAWVPPGASLPLVFPRVSVWFTAGPTTYEVEITLDTPLFGASPAAMSAAPDDGTTTVEPLVPTPEQHRLLLALAEPALRRADGSRSEIPSSADVARRLGWTMTKLNRKLDALCEKLDRQGVRGLHGGPDQLASNRRSRLVEYALSTRLVTREDLSLLDGPPPAGAGGQTSLLATPPQEAG